MLLFSDFLHKSSLPILIFFCKKSLLARHAFVLFERTTSKFINIPDFRLCYPCKCLARYARSPIICFQFFFLYTFTASYHLNTLRLLFQPCIVRQDICNHSKFVISELNSTGISCHGMSCSLKTNISHTIMAHGLPHLGSPGEYGLVIVVTIQCKGHSYRCDVMQLVLRRTGPNPPRKFRYRAWATTLKSGSK